jgi:hypothetical protein
MGDTDIFSDMGLIAEIHQPKVALVPIGDRFTMSPATAAIAVKRFFRLDKGSRATTARSRSSRPRRTSSSPR